MSQGLEYQMQDQRLRIGIPGAGLLEGRGRRPISKIEYYLAHPQERIEIACAGQQRTLSQHLNSP